MVRRAERLLIVEGGGDNNDALKTECRKGFRCFLEKAGFEGMMPRIVAAGGRRQAYDQFQTSVLSAGSDDVVILLVDSEAPVTSIAGSAQPWMHVKNRDGDGWNKPHGATDGDLHFMVECMESWFLADPTALREFYGQGFTATPIPKNSHVEQISKADVYAALKKVTKGTKTKGEYGKGKHAFKILALIDPAKVRAAAPYADRLLSHLDKVLK